MGEIPFNILNLRATGLTHKKKKWSGGGDARVFIRKAHTVASITTIILYHIICGSGAASTGTIILIIINQYDFLVLKQHLVHFLSR